MHGLVRWISRRALRWFYREVRIVGAERIPACGPVLLVGNHPNDLPDVLLGYLATDRPVRYVATAAAATSVLVRWTYQGLGVIPVARVRDARKMLEQGVDVAAANRAAFADVTAALARGDAVGVFPEGGVHTGPDIGQLRSGVARMVLDRADGGARPDLAIVPIGVQYERADRPRTAAVVVVGEPLPLAGWLAAGHPRPALALTATMRGMLTGVSRTAPSAEQAESRDRLIAATAAALWHHRSDERGRRTTAASDAAPPGPERRMPRNETLLEIATRVNTGWRTLMERPRVAEESDALAARVAAIGGDPRSSRDQLLLLEGVQEAHLHGYQPTIVSGARRRTLLLWPLAVPGLVLHGPAFAAIWWLSGRVSDDPSNRAARAIVPGLYLILLWYPVLALLLALALRAAGIPSVPVVLAALLALAVLPRLGDVAMRWRDDLATLRLWRRARGLPGADRAAVRASMRTLLSAWASLREQESGKAGERESVRARATMRT